MSEEYAKEVDSTLVFPSDEEFRGIPNWRSHEQAVRSRGYMPLAFVDAEREGFIRVPVAWQVVNQSEPRVEPRAVIVDEYEIDEETGERRKSGSHQEWQDTEIVFDTSFINVTECRFDPIPPPEPEPQPVVTYSKLKIVDKMLEYDIYDTVWQSLTRNQQIRWENAQVFRTDNQAFADGVAAFKQAFPSIDVDAILEQCITE